MIKLNIPGYIPYFSPAPPVAYAHHPYPDSRPPPGVPLPIPLILTTSIGIINYHLLFLFYVFHLLLLYQFSLLSYHFLLDIEPFSFLNNKIPPSQLPAISRLILMSLYHVCIHIGH